MPHRALRAILCVVACFAVLGMPTTTYAEEGDEPAAEAPKPEKVKGKLVSSTETSITVSVKSEDGEATDKTITLADGAKVTLDGEKAALADIPANTKVQVMLDADGKATKVKAGNKKDKAAEEGKDKKKKKDKKPKDDDEGGDGED